MTIDAFELLNFFGVEPELLDPDVPWQYNDAVYEIARGEWSLSFAIAPAYGDVRIVLRHSGANVHELNAKDVRNVSLLDEKGRTVLEVELNSSDRIWLRVDPAITVFHTSARQAT